MYFGGIDQVDVTVMAWNRSQHVVMEIIPGLVLRSLNDMAMKKGMRSK